MESGVAIDESVEVGVRFGLEEAEELFELALADDGDQLACSRHLLVRDVM